MNYSGIPFSGKIKSGFTKPAANCCRVYFEFKLQGEFINLCYDEEKKEPAALYTFSDEPTKHNVDKEKWETFKEQGIRSIDCGEETQASYSH